MANATSTQLQELYVAYFGRAADPTGLDYWTELGTTQAAFAANMYAQAEFKDAYGSKSVEAQVNQIYKNLFDREADVTGLTYWTQQINLGNLKVAEIATHLIWAAQNNSGSSDDKTALTNRTNAAVAYTAEVKSSTANILAYQPTTTDPWVAGANITAGVTYLSGIDKDTAHTAAGITASVATFSTAETVAEGSSFVLTTTSAGASTGGAGDDTWVALDDALTNYVVDGKGGTDSLTATVSSTTDSYDVSNVENITIKGTATSTVDFSDFSGESSVTASGSSNLSFTNNAAGTTFTSKLGSSATLGIALQDATGTADAVTLTLDNATSTGITTINAVETITVNGSNDNDTFTLTANEATSLTITGSKELTAVLPVAADLTTVSAGTMTGDLTIELPANDVTFTAGSGDDAITMSTSSLDEDDTIDGGAGADKLTLTATGNAFASVTDATTETLAVSNIETLAFTTGAANDAIDFDLFASPTDFTKVEITSTADAATLTLTDIQTDHVSIRNTNDGTSADVVAAVTYDLKDSTGTADAVTFDLINRDVNQDLVITTLTAAGIETATFNTTGGTHDDIAITTLTMTSLETVTITGDADLTLPAFSTTVETVTAGTTSGDLALTFAGADTTVTTGSGADTLTYGTSLDGEDTIDGGAGTDTLTASNLNDGSTKNIDLDISNIERFTFTETSDSDSDITFDFNGDVISRLTVEAEVAADKVLTFEDLGAGNVDLYITGSGDADDDHIVVDRASDGSSDSIDIFLTADNGENVFEGDILVDDEETITFDTTGTEASSPVIINDLDAADAVTVTFTNDDTWSAASIFDLEGNSIKTGATIDFSGYEQSIGNAVSLADVAGSDGQASSTGAVTDLATIMGTAGFTAPATGSFTIKLGDGRTGDADDEQVINLGSSNTGADTIQFVNLASDTANDFGVTVIHNFNDAAGAIVTNRSLLDLSAFSIEQVSDLTLTAAEANDGADLTVITATDTDDFTGAITVLGVAATDWAAADFVFA